MGVCPFRKETFVTYDDANNVVGNVRPPTLPAALLRPCCRKWVDIHDLHCSLAHAHDAVLHEAAHQLGTKITGRLGYYNRYAGKKEMRKAVAKSTLCRAAERMQRLFADVAGPMPKSPGGTQYYLMIVEGAANMGWPGFMPDKSAATVSQRFS